GIGPLQGAEATLFYVYIDAILDESVEPMKKPPVVAIIGAASLTFGPKALRDLVNHPGLDGATVRFMDIDEPHMDIMTRLARRLVDSVDHHINIESTTDRREALKDADYVLINIEVDRYTLW